jgi:hypothetical protein
MGTTTLTQFAGGGSSATTLDGLSDVAITTPTDGQVLSYDSVSGGWVNEAIAGTGTVTSVAVSGGTTGLSVTGSPITSSGTVTLGGTLAIANGGTGQTTANAAFNALAPSQTGNAGKLLTSDGTNTSWATPSFDSLSDVTITTPSSGQVVKYNGSVWVNDTVSGGVSNLEELTDVVFVDDPVAGDVLIYSGGIWMNGGVPASTLNGLSDVTITTPTAGQVVKYNGSAWVNDTVSGGGGSSTLTIDAKTGAYTVVAGDLGKIINCTANSFTVSLTAAATLGAGFNCWIWNTSDSITHVVTIDPNALETIDGVSTLILRRGEGVQIVCDGTNWQTGDKKAMRGYVENASMSSTRPIASGANSLAIGFNSNPAGSQAVTGAGAMALGGSYASGTDSFAAAIANNTSSYGATQFNGVALGYLNKAAGGYSLALGRSSTASASDAIVLGRSSQAAGQSSIVFGYNVLVSTAGKVGFGNISALSTGIYSGQMPLVGATTDATPKVLTSDTGAASTTNQLILVNNSAVSFTGTIVARQQASQGTATAAWEVKGVIRREGTAASTTLIASTVTAIDNTPAWTLALSADTTNGGLAVTFTGAAATNIRVLGTLYTSEVVY